MAKVRIYNSFQELNNELPPPPENIVNPPVQERRAEDRSFSDINSLFSYTRSRNTDQIRNPHPIKSLGRKIASGAKKAGKGAVDTVTSIAKEAAVSSVASAAGLQDEYAMWRAECLVHPEWTRDEQEQALTQIIEESKAKKRKDAMRNKRKRR